MDCLTNWVDGLESSSIYSPYVSLNYKKNNTLASIKNETKDMSLYELSIIKWVEINYAQEIQSLKKNIEESLCKKKTRQKQWQL